jgi:hypothetical protein
MKQRILYGWNFQRVLFLAFGILIIAQAISERSWVGLLPGIYFAAMGLFAFGCAGGNCFDGSCRTDLQEPKSNRSEPIASDNRNDYGKLF